MEAARLARFDTVVHSLNVYVDTLSKDLAKSCEVLLMFEVAGQTGTQTLRKFAVMGKPSYNPKFQMYAWCKWSDGNITGVGDEALPGNFEVELLGKPTRVSKRHIALASCTTDELAFELTSNDGPWSMTRLAWQPPENRSSAL
tara:strand:+ start:375 stop:803 length:429 start_codon:yes stop_codon:yes gene_type:complete